jgi:hypothetical protein
MIRFTEEECKKIIDLSNELESHERDESPRQISYTFYSIGWNKESKWIFDKLDSFFTEVTGIKVLKSLDAVHLFDYSVGDRFVRHRDVYYHNQIHNIGVCLNEDYEGGDFVLYEPEYKVLPKKTGEIYTFKHSYEHEVLEVTKGHRWSLIGFYFYEHLDLEKKIL